MIINLAAEPAANVTFWQDYIATQFDPAHLLSELGFALTFELLQFVFIYILWKRVVKPRWFAQAHEQFDAEHGISHHDDHVHVDDINEWHDDELIHGLNTGILKFGEPTPEQQRTFNGVLDKIEGFHKAEDAAWRRAQVPGDLGPL